MRIAALFALALALCACSDDLGAHDAPLMASELSGSVRIPLMATAADGTVYRLHNATFEISGSAMLTLSQNDAKGDSLVTPLPPGSYSVFLRSGWDIEEVKSDGSVSPADLKVISNPIYVEVGQMSDSTLALAFRGEGKELAFGGSVPVRVTAVDLSL